MPFLKLDQLYTHVNWQVDEFAICKNSSKLAGGSQYAKLSVINIGFSFLHLNFNNITVKTRKKLIILTRQSCHVCVNVI